MTETGQQKIIIWGCNSELEVRESHNERETIRWGQTSDEDAHCQEDNDVELILKEKESDLCSHSLMTGTMWQRSCPLIAQWQYSTRCPFHRSQVSPKLRTADVSLSTQSTEGNTHTQTLIISKQANQTNWQTEIIRLIQTWACKIKSSTNTWRKERTFRKQWWWWWWWCY